MLSVSDRKRIPVMVPYGRINICIIMVLCLKEAHVSLPLKTVGRGGVWRGRNTDKGLKRREAASYVHFTFLPVHITYA